MNHIDHYLLYEYKARQRAILISIACGTVLGMVLEGMSGVPFKSAAIIACSVTGGIQLLMALFYQPKTKKESQEPKPLFTVRTAIIRMAFSASALLAVSLGVPPAEASLIDERLRRALAGEPPYPDANKVIAGAMEADIPATPAVVDSFVARLLAALDQPANQENQDSIIQTLFNLNAFRLFSWTGLKLKMLWLPKDRVLLARGDHVIEQGIGEKWVYVFGRGADATMISTRFKKPEALFDVHSPKGDTVFADLGFANSGPFLPELVRITSASPWHFVLIDSEVTGFAQDVSRIIWCKVTFRKCIIRYSGGPLHLFAVRFINCTFEFNYGESQSLRNMLIRSGGQPIYFDRA